MKNNCLSILCISALSILDMYCTPNPTDWTEIGTPTSIMGQNIDDYLGYAVALSSDGKTIVTGEPYWPGNTYPGRVRAFTFNGTDWVEKGTATSMMGQNNYDEAGYSVAISSDGTTVAVGEPYWSSGRYPGRVRVFVFNGTDWVEKGTPASIIGQNNYDQSGYSVAINSNGTIVAVGEYNWSNGRGRVRAYQYDGSDWVEMGNPTAMVGENLYDYAGYSVAINAQGNMVAVGEYGWPNGQSKGRIRVYEYHGSDWTEVGSPTSIAGQNNADYGCYGISMNADGTVVAIGEYGWPNGNSYGRARVFKFNGTDWNLMGSPTAMTGQHSVDYAGTNVALNAVGDVIAVGEYGWPNGQCNGRARVYQYNGSDWTEIGSPTAMTGQNVDDTAVTVAINAQGNMVAVGEFYWSQGRGRVRVYENDFQQDQLSATTPSINITVNTHVPMILTDGTLPGGHTELTNVLSILYSQIYKSSSTK